ncbi:MAG: hypothetical protein AAGE01_13535 [Pseudomonadota bacterium]
MVGSLINRLSRALGTVKRRETDETPLSAYDVVLHIGAPKTGSSAIQYFANANRDRLLEYGFYYPGHGVDPNRVSGGHSNIGGPLINDRTDEAKKRFARFLRDARRQDATLVLSAESFYGVPEAVRDLVGEANAGVLAYFRDPMAALISAYNQLVKRHYGTMTLAEYAVGLTRRDSRRATGLILQDWVEQFGADRLHVLPYRRDLLAQGQAEVDFALRLGIPAAELENFDWPEGQINVSYSPSALELKRLINHVLDKRVDAELNQQIDWALQRYSDAQEKVRRSPRELLGDEAFEALRAFFAESNAYVHGLMPSETPPEVLDPPESAETGRFRARRRFSEEQVAEEALATEAGLIEELADRARRQVDAGKLDHDALHLAEILHVDVRQHIARLTCVALDAETVERILREENQTADYLREIAVILEAAGDRAAARKVIEKAIELRPGGKALQRIAERLDR